MKKIIAVMALCCLLTGCWDQKELAEVTVITGMAVDKGKDEKYYLSVEGINAAELNNRTAGGNAPSIVYGKEGNSLSELTNQMSEGISRNLVYSHMRTLIISEEVAEDGMLEFLDYLERNREMRDDFNIVISRGVRAEEVLKVTYQFQKSTSLKLHTQLDTMEETWGGDPGVRLNDVISAWTSPGRQPVMAAVAIKGDPEKGSSVENMKKVTPDALVVLDSLAIFEGGRLDGFLSLEDARNYLWTQDKIKSTSLTISCGENRYIDIRIYNTTTKTKARIEDGKAKVKIDIRGESYLEGTQCADSVDSVSTYEDYEEKTENHIERIVADTIRRVQKEDKADIFGFGDVVRRKDYKHFHEIEADWDQYFSEADVEVTALIKMRRTGIRTKSFLSETN
ncbi:MULTISPECIES: Ger(x)C family spore germination protein [Bacillaceae]|uniref:Ger(x)C family spore germination protein n=1 Tax=Bacillaceae TaxID=186817 RepID=UPI000B9C0E9B|nr:MULTISPECIES: Ger(x)C family spore germination protein [Bacillus]MCK6207974.1 Ger(x)C family spore germination protein [Bacillus infantis]MDW2878296.1 Ger(x)C family spore germination protein [Bacillus infantis]OXT17694.1 spore gernimation protein GerC [Bacillus sp. OG2]PLR70637.1 Ger(x)C family spore germination protein [Bacillus sp. UMB0728]